MRACAAAGQVARGAAVLAAAGAAIQPDAANLLLAAAASAGAGDVAMQVFNSMRAVQVLLLECVTSLLVNLVNLVFEGHCPAVCTSICTR